MEKKKKGTKTSSKKKKVETSFDIKKTLLIVVSVIVIVLSILLLVHTINNNKKVESHDDNESKVLTKDIVVDDFKVNKQIMYVSGGLTTYMANLVNTSEFTKKVDKAIIVLELENDKEEIPVLYDVSVKSNEEVSLNASFYHSIDEIKNVKFLIS